MCFRRWKFLLKKWHKCLLQNVTKQWSIHDPLKNANMCWALFANPCPDMYFYRMFWPGLKARLLTFFPVAPTPMGFQLNCSFVAPNDVIEVVVKVSTGKFQALQLVPLTNELAVGRSTVDPSKLTPV